MLLCKALIRPLEDCLKFWSSPFRRDQFQTRIDEENVYWNKKRIESPSLGTMLKELGLFVKAK